MSRNVALNCAAACNKLVLETGRPPKSPPSRPARCRARAPRARPVRARAPLSLSKVPASGAPASSHTLCDLSLLLVRSCSPAGALTLCPRSAAASNCPPSRDVLFALSLSRRRRRWLGAGRISRPLLPAHAPWSNVARAGRKGRGRGRGCGHRPLFFARRRAHWAGKGGTANVFLCGFEREAGPGTFSLCERLAGRRRHGQALSHDDVATTPVARVCSAVDVKSRARASERQAGARGCAHSHTLTPPSKIEKLLTTPAKTRSLPASNLEQPTHTKHAHSQDL